VYIVLCCIAALVFGMTVKSSAEGLLILTSDEIYTGLYTNLVQFIAHKEARGFTVFLTTVESATASVPPATHLYLYDSPLTTNETADQIRAYLRATYTNLGYRYVLLIGNPDPDDVTQPGDSVGDLPMKMTYPIGTEASPSLWYVPTDVFYRNLSSDWDMNDNGLFGEWAADHNVQNGLSLNPSELSVGRIPCYGSRDYAAVVSILQKIITYETTHPTNFCTWRYAAFQPDPIDWTDAYGAEGNVSPIFIAERLRTNYFLPRGIVSLTIREDDYTYEPWNFDPTSIIPEPRQYVCFTRYNTTYRFKALYNGSSDAWSDYETGISELTDNNVNTVYSNMFGPSDWLQFRLAVDDNRQYAPGRLELYASAVSNFPAGISVSMADKGSFSQPGDAFEIIRDDAVRSRAEWNGGVGSFVVRYDYTNNTLTRAGQRKYIRLQYTGSASQPVILSEVKAYSPEHREIKPYVLQTWTNRGFGHVIFTTHGGQTGASSIIDSSETGKLNDNQPGLVFIKACQTAWPENDNNLAGALLKNGAIASIGATRTSWGFNVHGHVMFYQHAITNALFGDALRVEGEELEDVNYFNWDGNYSDVFRFNLYGDPTVNFNFVYPEIHDFRINGAHSTTSTCTTVDIACSVMTNELAVTEMQCATSIEGLTNAWQPYVPYATYDLPPVFEEWQTLYIRVRNQGGLFSPVHSARVFLVPEPTCILILLIMSLSLITSRKRK
jgi:hypothetical protein